MTSRERLAALLLWLAGNALRLTILAVPPVIALIRDDYQLNATQVGLLSSIPPAFFAIAALGGSLLVARLGLMRALVSGLLLIALGGALRGIAPGYTSLLLTTVLMSIGVAIMQPIMPSAVRQWMPGRIGIGTAIYTNGILMGEVLPVWLTLPLVMPALNGSWRLALVAWSAPVVAVAVIIAIWAPRPAPTHADTAAAPAPPAQWWPDWHRGLVWRMGTMFLCIAGIYFTANAFIPIYLKTAGHEDLIGQALTALNLGQIPASFLLLATARRLERRAWPYVASGALSLVALAGFVLMVGPWSVFWAGVLGFSDAIAFILALTLPALLCEPKDVARTAAGTFTLCYGGAVLIAIVSGAAWDASGRPELAFVPMAACGIALAVIPWYMRTRRDLI